MKAPFLAIAASALLMAACGGGDAEDASMTDTTTIAPAPVDSAMMAAPMDSAMMAAPADSVTADSAGGDSVPEGAAGTP